METKLTATTVNGYVSKTKKTKWLRHIKKVFEQEVETKMALVHKLRSEIRQTSEEHQLLKLRKDLAETSRDIRAISFRFIKLPDSPKLSDIHAVYEENCGINGKEKLFSDFEVELIKEYKNFTRNVKRLRYGLRKQTADFHSGVYDLVIAASEGNTVASQKLEEELKDFIKNIASYYQYRLKKETRDDIRKYILSAMLKAIMDWRKNKHFGYLQWIVGRVRRALKDIMTATYQKEELEFTCDSNMMEEIEAKKRKASRYGSIEDGKRSKLNYVRKDRIWIWDASRRVGVSAQTLRNWDTSGKFLSKWQKIKGKKYRYYTQEDIGKLIKLNCEPKLGKYRPKVVAKLLKTSVKTLKRWEGAGKIPKSKRDSRGRFFTVEDVENICEITKKEMGRPEVRPEQGIRDEISEMFDVFSYSLDTYRAEDSSEAVE